MNTRTFLALLSGIYLFFGVVHAAKSAPIYRMDLCAGSFLELPRISNGYMGGFVVEALVPASSVGI